MWKGGVIFLLFKKAATGVDVNLWREARSWPWTATYNIFWKNILPRDTSVSFKTTMQTVPVIWLLMILSAEHLLDLSCSSWRPWMRWWTDCCNQLFPGFKTPGCGSHNSARHRHLHPSHAIAGTMTTWIYTAVEVEKGAPSSSDQNRPPKYYSKFVDLVTRKTARWAACCPA